MSLTSSIRNIESPHFYFELGELISSTGTAYFATNMLHLVDKLVPVTRVELNEWTLDQSQASVLDIKALGSAALPQDNPPPAPSEQQDEHPLLKELMAMEDALLIQMNARTMHCKSQPFAELSHQCSLVSRKSNRRCVITFYRPHRQRVFSLSELSFLKSLSHTLLPLIERHAQVNRQTPPKALHTWLPRPPEDAEQGSLQHEFNQRLSLGDINLSAREKEVCLGLLTGDTVPEIAEKLSVKNSSIETYLKRAAAKLGVSGRHGLARWMVGA